MGEVTRINRNAIIIFIIFFVIIIFIIFFVFWRLVVLNPDSDNVCKFKYGENYSHYCDNRFDMCFCAKYDVNIGFYDKKLSFTPEEKREICQTPRFLSIKSENLCIEKRQGGGEKKHDN